MDSTVLLLVERPGPEIDTLVNGLEAGGLTSIYWIAIGEQPESGVTEGGRLSIVPAQPDKASAAKRGLQVIYAQKHDCPSLVLVDTQHGYPAEEVLAFARAAKALPSCLVVGERKSKAESSFLARLAGKISQKLVQFFLGVPVNDLRSGLLAIPYGAIPALAIQAPLAQPVTRQNGAGAEFELEMIMAGKRGGYPIQGHLVQSGATDPAPAGRFMLNSMSFYFVMARYISTSLLTAVVDNLVFVVGYPLLHNVLVSIYLARLVAIVVNYFLLRKVVFYSSDKSTHTFPRYIAVVLISGLAASLLIDFFNTEFHTGVVLGKIIAELLLYLVNFAVLNKLVFVHRQPLD
jgi:putative flippase GtrA